MKTENQFYQSLPSWAKGAVALAVIAGSGIIGFAIYKKVKSINEKSVSNETADSAEDEYIRLKKKGGAEGTLSHPQTKYFSAASAIKNALDGCDSKLGEEDAVNAVLGVVKKPIDWYYLVNVFGSREIEDCLYGSTTYGLPELLMQQLGHMAESFPPKNYIDVLRRELKKIGVEL
jgi:hypothetical protein